MENVICHICLRTDITAVQIPTVLADFVDELCDFGIMENPRYKYCTICVHLLKKFYNFKQRCLKACKILRSIKGRPRVLPTDLYTQIPSSIGPCTTLARYKLLEHKHDTATDITESKPVTNETNNADIYIIKLEETDPIGLPDIEVKDELIHDELDSNQTMQVLDSDNTNMITTNNGHITIDRSFKRDTNHIKPEVDKKLNTNTNKDAKDNTNQSKINDYLKSFEDEIRNFDADSVDSDNMESSDNMEVKDNLVSNNDPLRDDESLNSMDDIESDISDISNSDVESLPMEPDSESDSDLESLTEILKRAKDKKIKVEDINDLGLAQILLKIDKKNKVLKKRVKYLKDKEKIKENILSFFKDDVYDLGDGLQFSKELFMNICNKYEKNLGSQFSALTLKDSLDENKIDTLLRYLHKMYNPEYETQFEIEYLDTEEKKLEEFNRRKDRAEYQNAAYKCDRCYKGFSVERRLAYHMKRHDESSGSHICHICSMRFPSAKRRRAHTSYCHTAVYRCRQCDVSFYYFATMLNHFDLHRGVEYPCTICNGIYRSYTALMNHKRTHVTSHICPTCARSFVSAKGLHIHRRFKHKGESTERGAGAVRCSECGLTLDSQLAYKRHMRISHRSRHYACHCQRYFPSLAELRQHRVDAGHQYCSRDSHGNAYKSKKIKEKQATRPATKICPVCNEELSNKPLVLYKHHQIHHPGVPYFSEQSRLNQYLCDECGKSFSSESIFLDHKNIHTGSRPYCCTECPRTYATQYRLWNHSVFHRPPTHECKQCGKLFKSASNLACHVRIHKNDRRYICDVCSASFIHSASLTAHIKGVHQKQRRVRKPRK